MSTCASSATLAPSGVHPLFFIEGIQGASLFYVSEAFALRGPNTYFSGTAEAGLTAIARAHAAIRRGDADVALAGGADAPVCWWNMAKIDSIGLTTRSNELGAGACRPYDSERDGTVMGEGGAFVVLEELDAARARGARIYAELSGSGAATDVAHLLTPEPDGQPARARDRRRAAQRGRAGAGDRLRRKPRQRHATRRRERGTRAARGLRRRRGAPLVSSVKPATGHLGAGAGALNLAVAALAVHHQQVPPTLNLNSPDPRLRRARPGRRRGPPGAGSSSAGAGARPRGPERGDGRAGRLRCAR
jgi:3-oxoacyl-[acyl-carrier-protein] synthase II